MIYDVDPSKDQNLLLRSETEMDTETLLNTPIAEVNKLHRHKFLKAKSIFLKIIYLLNSINSGKTHIEPITR